MIVIKTITTVLIILMMLIIMFFMKDFKWKHKNDHTSIIGFSFMQMVYVLSLVCIWM